MEPLFVVSDSIYRFEDDIIMQQKDTLLNQNSLPKISSLITESKATQIQELIRTNNDKVPDWGLWLILGAFLLLVVGKSVYPRKLRLFFQTILGVSYMNQLLREWSPAKNAIGFCCFLFYSILQTLLFSLLISYYTTNNAGSLTFECFYQLYLIILVVHFFRSGLIYLLSWLFKTAEITLRYRTLTLSISTITAIFLIPFMLIIMYNPQKVFFTIGCSFVIIAFIFKILRLFIEIVSTTNLSRFYIFLYLCALEVVPLLLALKFVIDSLL